MFNNRFLVKIICSNWITLDRVTFLIYSVIRLQALLDGRMCRYPPSIVSTLPRSSVQVSQALSVV